MAFAASTAFEFARVTQPKLVCASGYCFCERSTAVSSDAPGASTPDTSAPSTAGLVGVSNIRRPSNDSCAFLSPCEPVLLTDPLCEPLALLPMSPVDCSASSGHQGWSTKRLGSRVFPRSAWTHIVSVGVPETQCPGRDPTASGFAPSFKSFFNTATAGTPAPSAAAHAACHKCGPHGFNVPGFSLFSFSASLTCPVTTRRCRYSSSVGTCVNVVFWSTLSMGTTYGVVSINTGSFSMLFVAARINEAAMAFGFPEMASKLYCVL